MSKIKTILSIIFIFNIWGCVSSAYPILLWWSWECVLYLIIIIKPEVWIINHCLGLGHETMVCAVCLTMFLWCLTKASDSNIWCFFDLHLNKRLSKQLRRRWFETPSRSLWHHSNYISCGIFIAKSQRPMASQITGHSTDSIAHWARIQLNASLEKIFSNFFSYWNYSNFTEIYS